MKVLLWTEGFWPHIGGVSVISAQYSVALQARGYECLIVTSHHDLDLPDRESYCGIPVYRFPVSQALVARDLKWIKVVGQQIAELKRVFQPDVIHLHECGPSNFFHLHTAAAWIAPTIVTIHSILPQSARSSGLLVQMLNSADWIGAVSEAMLNDVRRLAPQITPRSSLIYDALEIPDLQPTPLATEAFDAPRLLCAGRVVYDKGFDVALDAFAIVIKRFPRARLIIAGDGDARTALQKQAAELGLSDAVEFTGWVLPDRIPGLVNTATLVIMPSRWREPFGLVALQAGQMARPIVATRAGGLPEIVVHQKTGLLVANEDRTALADAITFILEHPETARQMGQAGRRRAQDLFAMDHLVDSYERVYQNLVQQT